MLVMHNPPSAPQSHRPNVTGSYLGFLSEPGALVSMVTILAIWAGFALLMLVLTGKL